LSRQTVWRNSDKSEGGTIFYRTESGGKRLSRFLSLAYVAGGKEIVVSTKTESIEDAERELRRLLRRRENAKEGLEPLVTPTREKLTVKQLVDAYLDDREHDKRCSSIVAMRSHAKPLLAALGSVRALDVGPDHVRVYRKQRETAKAQRRAGKVSAAKIARELEILKAAFTFAAEEGRIRYVPVIKLPTVKNARKVFFPLERVPELLEKCAARSEDVRDFLQWQSFGGMRPKAIRLLRWSDLDERDWTLTLRSEEDKNEYGRELALGGEAREIIERRLAKRRPGDLYIFGGSDPIPNKLVWRTWNLVMTDMELPSGEKGFRPYDLKKSALRALRRSGIPEERAMYFSGHTTASTFRRYDLTDREDNRADMERASAYRRERFKAARAESDKSSSASDNPAKLLRIPKNG
jgi:integrase